MINRIVIWIHGHTRHIQKKTLAENDSDNRIHKRKQRTDKNTTNEKQEWQTDNMANKKLQYK